MSSVKFNPQTVIVLVFIVVTGTVRVLLNYEASPVAYYSPIGAMALFGGAYFNRSWKAFLFPLGALFLSDFVLHQTIYKAYSHGLLYSGWYWVYGALVLMVITGRRMMKKPAAGSFLAAVLVTVFIHWIVTDLGVWAGSKIYAQTPGGFISCLVAAVPFEWQFLAGTLVYGAVLFGGYAWMRSRYPVLQLSKRANNF